MSHLNDKCCDLCQFPDPILFVPTCNHVFHSRCVHVWPLRHCPVCDIVLPHLCILPIRMDESIPLRYGKWTVAETAFVDMMLSEFNRDTLPLANGTPLRMVLAKLLNCSPMRVSKKFQKKALGKQTISVRKPLYNGNTVIESPREAHRSRQITLSLVENGFRQTLATNPREGGGLDVVQDLRKAVKQYWVAHFLHFAVSVHQSVEGMDISNGKMRKVILDLLRRRQYQQFVWPFQAQPLLGPVWTQPEPEHVSFSSKWMYVCLHPSPSLDPVQEFPPHKRQRTEGEEMQWSHPLPVYEQVQHEDQQQESTSNQDPLPDMYEYSVTTLYNNLCTDDQSSEDHAPYLPPTIQTQSYKDAIKSPTPSQSIYPVRPYPEYRGPISSVTMSRSIVLDDPWMDFLEDDIPSNTVNSTPQPWSTLQIC